MEMEWRTRVRQTEMPNEIAEGLGSLRSPGVSCIKPLNRRLDLPPQAGFVERQHAAPAQHEATVNHHAVDRRAVLCKHQLPQRIAQRYVVDVADVEKDDVCPIIRLQAADVVEAENRGTSLGRGSKRLFDRQPACGVGVGDAR